MSADPDLIRSMTPIQSSLHNTRGRVDGVCVPPHASILACIQFVRYRLDVLAHDVNCYAREFPQKEAYKKNEGLR